MKIKFNKKITISTIIGLVLISIIITVILSNKNIEQPNNETIDKIEFTKDFENGISISGDIKNIDKIKIVEVLENSKEFNKYKTDIESLQKKYNDSITKAVIYEISFLDKNGKEIIPEKTTTVFFESKSILLTDGTISMYLYNNGTPTEYQKGLLGAIYKDRSQIFFELDKSNSVIVIAHGEPVQINGLYDYTENTETNDDWDLNISEGYSVPNLTQKEAEEKYNITNPELIEGINYINKFDGVGLVYIVSNADSDENFNLYNVEFAESYSSLIYLDDKKDVTENALTNEKLNFEEVFGFDYKKCKGPFDIFYEFLKYKNINFNFEDATFDKTFYLMANKEILYDIDNDIEIAKNIMGDLKYDEIISAEVRYELDKSKEPNLDSDKFFIDMVNIQVFYKIDGNIKSRTAKTYIMLTTEEVLDEILNDEANYE